MKHLILPLIVAFFTLNAQAEYITSTASEEEMVEMAKTQAYPGGIDEDELSVQTEILEAKQHITAATLQWRAEQALTRDTAASKTSE